MWLGSVSIADKQPVKHRERVEENGAETGKSQAALDTNTAGCSV